MFGILTGMKITLKHLFSPKVTRLYPYEKRQLPPRMRGLIQYLRDETGQFKCEGCLLCEKICPPQAITVSYRERATHRDRPLTLPNAVWGNFVRSRRSLRSRAGRPERALDRSTPQDGEPAVDWTRVVAHLEGGRRPTVGLPAALLEIQNAVGYLPRHAVARLADEAGVDLSGVYSLATGMPGFRTLPATAPAVAVCRCLVCRSAGAADLVRAVADALAATGSALSPAAPNARCLGDSRQAPVLRVNGRAYGNVTPDAARRIVRENTTVGGSPR